MTQMLRDCNVLQFKCQNVPNTHVQNLRNFILTCRHRPRPRSHPLFCHMFVVCGLWRSYCMVKLSQLNIDVLDMQGFLNF